MIRSRTRGWLTRHWSSSRIVTLSLVRQISACADVLGVGQQQCRGGELLVQPVDEAQVVRMGVVIEPECHGQLGHRIEHGFDLAPGLGGALRRTGQPDFMEHRFQGRAVDGPDVGIVPLGACVQHRQQRGEDLAEQAGGQAAPPQAQGLLADVAAGLAEHILALQYPAQLRHRGHLAPDQREHGGDHERQRELAVAHAQATRGITDRGAGGTDQAGQAGLQGGIRGGGLVAGTGVVTIEGDLTILRRHGGTPDADSGTGSQHPTTPHGLPP